VARKQFAEEPDARPGQRPDQEPEVFAAPPPGRLLASVADVLSMQRSAGNVAVRGLLRDTPPAKEKTDEEWWEEDWNNKDFAAAKAHFKGEDRPKGDARHRYLTLAPLYKSEKGITRPLKWVHENIVWGTFFGHGTYMHRNLKAALKKAEDKLKADGESGAPFKKLWAFNPRTQTGGQWSNHADGKAIDFDEVTNPRLLNPKHRAVISALTDFDISAKDPGAGTGMDSYDAAQEASDRFQSGYNVEGMTERIEKLGEEEVTLEKERMEIAGELGAIPTGGKGKPKPTVQQKADAKRLKEELAATQADLKSRVAARKTLEAERARFQALDKAVEDLQTETEKLSGGIDLLQNELDQLEDGESLEPGKAPLAGKALAKQVAERKAAIKRKAAAVKAKQKQLDKALSARDDDTLRGYADLGFLDLYKPLVEALKGAGMDWGGDYGGPKDFMHFDVK
jgi:hypothetical protein